MPPGRRNGGILRSKILSSLISESNWLIRRAAETFQTGDAGIRSINGKNIPQRQGN